MIKKTAVVQVPIIPASKTEIVQLIKDIGVDVKALTFMETVDPINVEFEQIGEIEQFADEGLMNRNEIQIQSAKEIEAIYSSHKRMDIQPITAITDLTLIHGVRGVNGKLILFDYNTMTKYIDDQYDVGRFKKFEQLIVQEQ